MFLPPAAPESGPYSELLRPLYEKRKILGYAYFLLLVIAAPIFLIGPNNIVARLRGAPTDFPDSGSVWLVFIFLVTQILFLWGGGSIRQERKLPAHFVLSSLATGIVVWYSIAILWLLLSTWDYEILDHPDSLGAVLLIGVLLVLGTGIRKSRRTGYFQTLIFLNLAASICVGTLATLSLALAMAIVQAWGPAKFEPMVLAYPAYAIAWVLGTWLVLLWHRETPCRDSATGRDEDARSIDSANSGPYIVSVARVSSLLLIVLYFGISQSWSYGSHLNEIGEARRAFALEAMRNHVLPILAPNDIEKVIQTTDATERQNVSAGMKRAIENKQLPTTLGIVEETLKIVFGAQQSCLRVSVKEYQIDRGWSMRSCFVTESLQKSLALSDRPYNLMADPPAEDMATVAVRHGLKPDKDESFEALYLRIENDLLRTQVAFPNSGFSFPIEQAVWLSDIVVCLMLVYLYDRLGQALVLPNPVRGEPWLVLDARERLAKCMSALWCLAIGAGPWLLILTTLRMVFFDISVYQSPLALVLFEFAMTIVLMAVSVPLSLRFVSRVLRLKKQRQSFQKGIGVPG